MAINSGGMETLTLTLTLTGEAYEQNIAIMVKFKVVWGGGRCSPLFRRSGCGISRYPSSSMLCCLLFPGGAFD